MDTASIQFVCFGLAVALVINLSHSRIWRSAVLFVANVVFLVLLSRDPAFFVPLAGFLVLGYAGLVLIKRRWAGSSVCSILGMILAYAWLKKYTFLPEGIFIHSPYFTLGLSYIFFRVLHLLIEAGDGVETRRIGPVDYLLYTLNFTTFVSGPIQRYDEFARDQSAATPVPLGPRMVGLQLDRIVRGFFKVNVLALFLNIIRVDALAQLSQPLSESAKMYAAFQLAVVYPFFLYVNFSGYIDIVIGLARLMRLRLPENFDRPFSSSSFLEFWTRWHITLSTWLKTYVYNPLLVLLLRNVPSTTLEPFLGVFAFFATFFLVGIWHGRTSEFVAFGILQGGGVAINKLWQLTLTRVLGRKSYKVLAANSVYIAWGRGLTFSWFAFTLFWFWSDWTTLKEIVDSLSVIGWLVVWLSIGLSSAVVLSVWEWLRAVLLSIRLFEAPALTSRYARVVYASAFCLGAVGVIGLLNQPAPDIVYKAF